MVVSELRHRLRSGLYALCHSVVFADVLKARIPHHELMTYCDLLVPKNTPHLVLKDQWMFMSSDTWHSKIVLSYTDIDYYEALKTATMCVYEVLVEDLFTFIATATESIIANDTFRNFENETYRTSPVIRMTVDTIIESFSNGFLEEYMGNQSYGDDIDDKILQDTDLIDRISEMVYSVHEIMLFDVGLGALIAETVREELNIRSSAFSLRKQADLTLYSEGLITAETMGKYVRFDGDDAKSVLLSLIDHNDLGPYSYVPELSLYVNDYQYNCYSLPTTETLVETVRSVCVPDELLKGLDIKPLSHFVEE